MCKLGKVSSNSWGTHLTGVCTDTLNLLRCMHITAALNIDTSQL